jgi:drug/metabolite transporter (DMT)-like permease
LLWGTLHPAAPPALAAVGPLVVTLDRVVLASLVLGSIAWWRRGPRFVEAEARRNWRGILALAGLSFALSTILAMTASALLPASANGLLNNTHPLWVAIGSAILYPPRRPWLLVGGSVVALLGVVLVFFPDLSFGDLVGSSALNPLGVALSLAGSGVIATSTAVGRRVMPGSDPVTVSALASGAAVPPLVILTLAIGHPRLLLAASPAVVGLLLYVGIGCTALNFTLWYYGLKHLPAARASSFQYLIPPLGVVFSAIFLDEALGPGLVLGGALILAGLALTQVASGAAETTRHSTLVGPR